MDEILNNPNLEAYLFDTFVNQTIEQQLKTLFGSTKKGITEFKKSDFYNEREDKK
jgi:hypothetical protein